MNEIFGGRFRVVALASVSVLMSGSCMMPVEEEGAEAEPGEPVTSITQSLSDVDVLYVRADSEFGLAGANCPDDNDHPYMLGGGAFTFESGGIRGITPLDHRNTFGIPHGIEMNSSNVTASVGAVAVCSEAPTSDVSITDSDGHATVTCSSGKIAVGGGGFCGDFNAKLYRSRPSPDTDGSEPTGWTASCTSGPVTVYAICVNRSQTYDFTNCRTQRVDENDGAVDVACPTGELITSAGAYCGSSNHIEQVRFLSGLTSGIARCSGNTVHGYAVCCDSLEF